ncbi:MAG TPA: GGDEF domain-containing protein, partial [Kineosporiaceae bacterium]|nr:GGDEF domain-containing protein [Kineosporiaceae bacterium]
VRLAWQSMDLVAETARQALEHQALRVESRTDALTGVGNRRALDEELRSMLRFSPMPLSLVLVDVDDFKRVNDRFTHVVGDEVLRRVAGALSQLLRGGDRLVRYGGDEFVVLLPLTSDQEARAVAARMTAAIAKLTWNDLGDGLSVGITTGYAALWSLSHRRPDGDAEELFRLADEQLLEAKRRRGTGEQDRQRSASRGRRAAPGQHTPARGIGGSPEVPEGSAVPEVRPAPAAPRAPAAPTAPAVPDFWDVREVPEVSDQAFAATPRVGLEVFALGDAPLLDELLDEPLHERAPLHNGARSDGAQNDGAQNDGALPEYESARATTSAAHVTAAGLQLPFSPAAGLPLYRALLQDPPQIDRTETVVPEPQRDAATPRSRRRPKVIDLSREDDRRSPFG